MKSLDVRRESGLALAPGLLGLLFVATYATGYFFPDHWWATHFIAFVPPWFGIILLTAATILCINLPKNDSSAILDIVFRHPSRVALVLALVLFGSYLSSTIASDIYGDARRNLSVLSGVGPELQTEWLRTLVIPSLTVETGEETMFAVVSIVMSLTGLSAEWVFRLLNALSGSLFVFLWVRLVLKEIPWSILRLVLIVSGVSAPFTVIFLGHTEIYAASYTATLLFWMVIIRLVRQGGWRWIVLGAVALYVVIRLHVANLVFAPVYLVALAFVTVPSVWRERVVRWRSIVVVLLVLFAIASVWYVASGEFRGTHIVRADEPHSKPLLPLVSSEDAPVQRYTLLSLDHVFDVVNVWLLWVPAAWFLILCALLLRRDNGKRQDPALLVGVLGFSIVTAMFFMFNPALGPQRDWDLLCFPATTLLVVCVLLLRTMPAEFGRITIGPVVALSILVLPTFWVSTNVERLSRRLESASIRAFESYWNGATYMLNSAIRMLELPDEERLARRLIALEKVEARQTDEHDTQISFMYAKVGWDYFSLRDAKSAHEYFQTALAIDKKNIIATEGIAASAFNLDDYETSLHYALLVLADSPTNTDYLELGFRSAATLGQFELAIALGRDYLKLVPDNKEIAELLNQIETTEVQPKIPVVDEP